MNPLFTPLPLKGTTPLKNRIVMGSMHTGLEEDKKELSRLAAFYKERAQAEVGLIITGGISPNIRGRLSPFAAQLTTSKAAKRHELITSAVHEHEGKIALQILHAGRYAYHPFSEAPSALKSPITPFKPWAMSRRRIRTTISHFIRCASLAKQAGYDGVELMGSEGYLINQFITAHTNQRSDEWGGSFRHRIRFPIKIVEGIRDQLGPEFIIIYRLSMIDLIDAGSSWDEVIELAQAIETAGATLLNTGIGWHEARIPTIATIVPAGGFAAITRRLKPHVTLPLIASNRINTPELAAKLLESGEIDLISMARPFLADPAWVLKAKNGHSKAINPCIACNQACLDHVFQHKTASCLVNPRAGNETTLVYTEAHPKKRIAIVGAGLAGLACASVCAERGHDVTLYEQKNEIGGQFNWAKKIPGKAEFQGTIDYFNHQLEIYGVTLHLNTTPSAQTVFAFDEVILATGVIPRRPEIKGIDHPSVSTYAEILSGEKQVGHTVAIIGAGGIGFDIAHWLIEDPDQTFYEEWGIDLQYMTHGGLCAPKRRPPTRTVHLLQRKQEKLGIRLGKTTGWIRRALLQHHHVHMHAGVSYLEINDQGLHILKDDKPLCLAVDTIILCTGQQEWNPLKEELVALGHPSVHTIGGAYKALELDAQHAIHQATRLAALL